MTVVRLQRMETASNDSYVDSGEDSLPDLSQVRWKYWLDTPRVVLGKVYGTVVVVHSSLVPPVPLPLLGPDDSLEMSD